MKSIGALIFPDFELLDLFGPMEMFGSLPEEYELHLVAQTSGPIQSAQTLHAIAEFSMDQQSDFDILLVPGGPGTRQEVNNPVLLDWIDSVAQNADYVLSVCTGSALLAKAGLLDDKQATTNKAAFSWVTSQGPKVHWQKKARWVKDECFFTSSGVSAGMDMALAVIATMHGAEKAKEVAVWCEYDWHQDASWDPFSSLYD